MDLGHLADVQYRETTVIASVVARRYEHRLTLCCRSRENWVEYLRIV